MNREKIREIGNRLVQLEKKSQKENSEQYMEEMAHLVAGLSLEDLIRLDEYVSEKLLTK